MNQVNRVMLADSYKYSHAKQYPDMVSMYDYMESRGGKYPATVFVGLQGIIKEYLLNPITIQEVNQAKAFAELHGVPFDTEGWEYIVGELGGKLPVEIKAVDEGSLIPVKHVLLTIESTDKKVAWVAGWLETLLMKLWYPTNIATKSYYVKQMLMKCGSPEWAQFAYHNFGDRGSSSVEAAEIGGYAHLTQFMGTDNFNALKYCFDNYGIKMAGWSVFASEHSTTTAHGKDGEEQFVIRMLEENPDAPIMSFVADSYDVYAFTDMCTRPDSTIREIIESRQHQKFVLRPDSGEPLEVLDKMITIMRANKLETVPHPDGKHLFKDFGILWGDGITPEVIEEILIEADRHKFAAENFVFGSGGDLMQNHNRDTQRFAVKCSSITVDDNYADGNTPADTDEPRYRDIDVFKDPITDPGKKSKRGKVTTYYNEDTKQFCVNKVGLDFEDGSYDILNTVYRNGELLKEFTMDEVRENITRGGK